MYIYIYIYIYILATDHLAYPYPPANRGART